MKSVIEILGGAQILFGVSFNIQDSFEEYLTEQHRAFLAMLRVIEEHLPQLERRHGGRGRPRLEDRPICPTFPAKSFFQIKATSELLNRLRSDSSLRRICGLTVVPSAATFSRRLKGFSDVQRAVSDYHEGLLVGHINRDSTPTMAREKPRNKQTDVRPAKALRELDHCAWGCKRNSQGKCSSLKGYKLHLTYRYRHPGYCGRDGGKVHDSQVAIAMEKLTASRVRHPYSLMDSACDAADIRSWISACGRKAIRSTVERSNAHLKDWWLPSKLPVKGQRG